MSSARSSIFIKKYLKTKSYNDYPKMAKTFFLPRSGSSLVLVRWWHEKTRITISLQISRKVRFALIFATNLFFENISDFHWFFKDRRPEHQLCRCRRTTWKVISVAMRSRTRMRSRLSPLHLRPCSSATEQSGGRRDSSDSLVSRSSASWVPLQKSGLGQLSLLASVLAWDVSVLRCSSLRLLMSTSERD